MCITPNRIENGQLVACRLCKLCIRNRIDDYVGRCIAEHQTSDGVLCVDLTYGGGDTPNSATLIYPDFQKFIKKLRKKYSVRYIVAGEFGSKKGRAHWHAILFFKGKMPEVELEKEKYTFPTWEHGFSYFKKPSTQRFAYTVKYALKDATQEVHTRHPSMSKKPPLGYHFFLRLAEKYVDRGLSPQHPFYSFPDVKDGSGKLKKYMLNGRVRDAFIQHFISHYQKIHNKPHPYSPFIEEWEDKNIEEPLLSNEEYLHDISAKEADRLGQSYPFFKVRFRRVIGWYVSYPIIEFNDDTRKFFYEKEGKNCHYQLKTEQDLKDALSGKLVEVLHASQPRYTSLKGHPRPFM